MQNTTISTLFVGQNIIHLQEVHSTNDFLKDLTSKSEPLPEGTAIMADYQTAGRGQLNTSWASRKGENLMLSILLKPDFLTINKQFYISMIVSLAVCQTLRQFLKEEVYIKWPNDIYVNKRKVCGILIENIIQGSNIKYSILGIGINVNQTEFGETLSQKAASMKNFLHQHVPISAVLAELCTQLEYNYLKLKALQLKNIKENYESSLINYKKLTTFRKEGQIFEAYLIGVSDTGMLMLDHEGTTEFYMMKEIEFIL